MSLFAGKTEFTVCAKLIELMFPSTFFMSPLLSFFGTSVAMAKKMFVVVSSSK